MQVQVTDSSRAVSIGEETLGESTRDTNTDTSSVYSTKETVPVSVDWGSEAQIRSQRFHASHRPAKVCAGEVGRLKIVPSNRAIGSEGKTDYEKEQKAAYKELNAIRIRLRDANDEEKEALMEKKEFLKWKCGVLQRMTDREFIEKIEDANETTKLMAKEIRSLLKAIQQY